MNSFYTGTTKNNSEDFYNMKNTTIAIAGRLVQGKSETIYLLRDLIRTTYTVKENVFFDDGKDVKVIMEIGEIKIGIESEGDPDSRQPDSIKHFIKDDCNIIISTCRTRSDTKDALTETQRFGYRVIWSRNYRSEHVSHQKLNDLSANSLLELLDSILKGHL